MSDLPNAGKVQSLNPNPFGGGGLFNTSGKVDTAKLKQETFAARQDPGDGNPYWNQQGPLNDAKSWAYEAFMRDYGRGPTADELSQVLPEYDPTNNITNTAAGDAAVARMHIESENTPAKLYAKQQAEWQAAAPQHYDSVNQIISSTLGRQATQDELNHYAGLIASGQADPYQIQQFIQSTPEYQNAQDTKFRQGVDTQLQQSDTDFFNTQKGNIAQQYGQMGRATSPALDVALTQLASQLNSQRGAYMAQLSASQYGGNKQNAVAGYQNTQNDVAGRINANTQGIYNSLQNQLNRTQSVSDYNRMQGTWQQYANQGNAASPMGYLNAAGSGAMAGGAMGGPWGAVAGAGVGAAGYGASRNG